MRPGCAFCMKRHGTNVSRRDCKRLSLPVGAALLAAYGTNWVLRAAFGANPFIVGRRLLMYGRGRNHRRTVRLRARLTGLTRPAGRMRLSLRRFSVLFDGFQYLIQLAYVAVQTGKLIDNFAESIQYQAGNNAAGNPKQQGFRLEPEDNSARQYNKRQYLTQRPRNGRSLPYLFHMIPPKNVFSIIYPP